LKRHRAGAGRRSYRVGGGASRDRAQHIVLLAAGRIRDPQLAEAWIADQRLSSIVDRLKRLPPEPTSTAVKESNREIAAELLKKSFKTPDRYRRGY
jgi:hypothetical protein